jgi:hypothetical protein
MLILAFHWRTILLQDCGTIDDNNIAVAYRRYLPYTEARRSTNDTNVSITEKAEIDGEFKLLTSPFDVTKINIPLRLNTKFIVLWLVKHICRSTANHSGHRLC